jgi:hypothetical protein
MHAREALSQSSKQSMHRSKATCSDVRLGMGIDVLLNADTQFGHSTKVAKVSVPMRWVPLDPTMSNLHFGTISNCSSNIGQGLADPTLHPSSAYAMKPFSSVLNLSTCANPSHLIFGPSSPILRLQSPDVRELLDGATNYYRTRV